MGLDRKDKLALYAYLYGASSGRIATVFSISVKEAKSLIAKARKKVRSYGIKQYSSSNLGS